MSLVARGLVKVYGGRAAIRAVDDVSLELRPGERLAIRGRSGSGKSTLLALLGTLAQPTAGTIEIEGVDPRGLRPSELASLRAKRIGFVFQFPSLLPTLRAIDNVALPGMLAEGGTAAGHYTRAASLLAMVGLGDRLDALPEELSGGEQRRVAIARAIFYEPAILFADEPTADLDETTEAEVLDVLAQALARTGAALVLATHSAAALALAERTIELSKGRVHREERRAVASVGPVATWRVDAQAPPSEAETGRAVATEPLGAGAGRFLAEFAGWMFVAASIVFLADASTRWVQASRLEARRSAAAALERTALQQLRVDVDDVGYSPSGDYFVEFRLANVEPDKDLFVLAPAIRVFTQVGREWREAPCQSMGAEGQVLALRGVERFRARFQPEVDGFAELLPGYLHVRFTLSLTVSPKREPQGELFERVDDVYIHLRPRSADDEAILRKNRFPGKPPLWIPMPPH